MTTRAKAVDEQLAAIVAMLEDQRERQEGLMQQNAELVEEQHRCSARLAELDLLRESMRGLAETIEEHARTAAEPTRIAAEERVPAPVKVEPSGLSAGLQLDADEFVPTHTGAMEESAKEQRWRRRRPDKYYRRGCRRDSSVCYAF